MAAQHFAAALRTVKQILLVITAGTGRQADKSRVNEMFNKTGNTHMT
jgi:hypothetical protein